MNHDHSHNGMGKPMLLMIICCAIPILLVMAVSIFGLALGPLQGLVPYVAALMCPLMMILMMRGMMHSEKHDHAQHHMHTQVQNKAHESLPNSVVTSAAPSSGKDSCH